MLLWTVVLFKIENRFAVVGDEVFTDSGEETADPSLFRSSRIYARVLRARVLGRITGVVCEEVTRLLSLEVDHAKTLTLSDPGPATFSRRHEDPLKYLNVVSI